MRGFPLIGNEVGRWSSLVSRQQWRALLISVSVGILAGLLMAHVRLHLGLPGRLRDVRVGKDDLARCAREAMKQERLLVNNPREVTEADARAIYEAAW